MNTFTKSNKKAFGYQLLLDLYNCKPTVCDDLSLCYQFLDDAVIELGMEKQSPPNIFRSDAVKFPDKAGLSGWVPLIESSIVIHTLSVKDFISIDIYCCKCFSIEKAKAICQRFFGPQRMDTQYIERGQDYYKIDSTYHSMTVQHTEKSSPKIIIDKKEPEVSVV